MNPDLHVFAAKLDALKPSLPAGTVDNKGFNGQALFGALLNNELRAQVGDDAFRHAEHAITEYFEAVLLCRKKELPAALRQLQRADALMPALASGTEEFVTLFKLSAWGNYYYQACEGNQAVELLRQGLRISADLERRGYGAFIFRRIEQLQNIANIYFKQQQDEAAHRLLKNVLTFMHSGRATDLLIEDWDTGPLAQLRIMQESTLHAVLRHIAVQNTRFMDHPVYDNAYYYRFYFKDLLVELETNTYNRVVLYNWTYAKASFFEAGPAAFLENVLAFLADEAIIPTYNVLKANLLAQALWYIGQQQLASPHPVIESIQNFARHHITDSEGRAIRLAA
jgi:hypothetical protein